MKTYLLLSFFTLFFASCEFPGSKRNNNGSGSQQVTEKTIIPLTTACILSEISYCPDPESKLSQYLPGWNIVFKPVPVGGNYAFVATDGNIYAIGIRGSLLEFSGDALSNWLYNDLNVASQKDWSYSEPGTNARISNGSYIGWQNLNQLKDTTSGALLWDFLNALPADAPIVLTGHSLGGNLATVYASYLKWQWKQEGNPKKNINVITFAAPAAGNKGFAESFDKEFPNSIRVENSNDIVPKFPVSGKIADLGNLFAPTPSASNVSIGYKGLTVTLSKTFLLMSGALDLLRITNNVSPYVQTNGTGSVIQIPLSGTNNSDDAKSWFAEAGYQHGMAKYSAALKAPVIDCDEH